MGLTTQHVLEMLDPPVGVVRRIEGGMATAQAKFKVSNMDFQV